MRKILRILLPPGLVVLAIVVVAGLYQLAQGKRPERKEEAEAAVLVETIPARVQSLNLTISSQGTVKPRTETTLVAEVGGKIIQVSPNFVAGGFFRNGETLLQIDPSDYDAALQRAQADLAAREAQLADQQARSDQALKDWKNLGRSGEPSDLTLRKPQLAEAQAAVKAAQASLLEARRDLERTRITAPYDGLVRNKQADVGQYVSPGTPLGVSFSIETAEIRLPLTSRDIGFLQLPSATADAQQTGPRVRLTAAGSGITGEWWAEIIRTEGVIDEASRVLYAVAEVVDPYAVLGQSEQSALRMGTFVRAEIEGIRADNVIALPRSVLRQDNTVLVANDQRKLEIRPVEVLRAEPEIVYLTSGIRDGERVITTAMDAPLPNTQLAISGEPAPAGATDSVAEQRSLAGDRP